MTICCRTHRQGDEILVAACDEELLGTTLRDGKVQLEVHEEFYGTDPIDQDGFQAQLRAATIANLTGEEAVGTAIELGFIDPDRVLDIDGVPHAQLAVMPPSG